MSLTLLIILLGLITSGMKYFSKTVPNSDNVSAKILSQVKEKVPLEEIPQATIPRSLSQRQEVSRSTVHTKVREVINSNPVNNINKYAISDSTSPIITPQDISREELVKYMLFNEILSVPKSKR